MRVAPDICLLHIMNGLCFTCLYTSLLFVSIFPSNLVIIIIIMDYFYGAKFWLKLFKLWKWKNFSCICYAHTPHTQNHRNMFHTTGAITLLKSRSDENMFELCQENAASSRSLRSTFRKSCCDKCVGGNHCWLWASRDRGSLLLLGIKQMMPKSDFSRIWFSFWLYSQQQTGTRRTCVFAQGGAHKSLDKVTKVAAEPHSALSTQCHGTWTL